MNLRLFSIALLMSSLPPMAFADASVAFNKGDFIAAEKISRDGETTVSVKLSKSGKAKKNGGHPSIHTEIAGVSSDFDLK